MTANKPSRGALEWADALIGNLQKISGASCLRDDLEDHRIEVRTRIAEMLDRVADGRLLCVDENGPY